MTVSDYSMAFVSFILSILIAVIITDILFFQVIIIVAMYLLLFIGMVYIKEKNYYDKGE